MNEYENLLKRARKDLPEQVLEKERFEPPRFESFVQGAKTIIKNFSEVANLLQRDQQHLIKFIAEQAGTQGEMDNHRLVIKGQKTQNFLNNKLDLYIKEFIICKQCGKPDTEIRTEEGIARIKCKACSAKYTVRKI